MAPISTILLKGIYGMISHNSWDLRAVWLMQQVENPRSKTNTCESALGLIHQARWMCCPLSIRGKKTWWGQAELRQGMGRRNQGAEKGCKQEKNKLKGQERWMNVAFPLRLHTSRQEIKTGHESLRVWGLLRITQCCMTENTRTVHSTSSKHARNLFKRCITCDWKDVH